MGWGDRGSCVRGSTRYTRSSPVGKSGYTADAIAKAIDDVQAKQNKFEKKGKCKECEFWGERSLSHNSRAIFKDTWNEDAPVISGCLLTWRNWSDCPQRLNR